MINEPLTNVGGFLFGKEIAMEEQKYCIKHKLSNGTYLAILNNGWRYDGSFIVEADSELELNAKLNEARYDDR